MSKVKLNIIVNFIGKIWTVLILLILTPVYIKYLGMEAFGIVGFYITFQALLNIFDFGVKTTVNRELARFSENPEKIDEVRNKVRTLEIIYWFLGILLGVILLSCAPLIAEKWLQNMEMPVNTVKHSIMLMGVVLTLQWALNFYKGGLLGLQKQVLLNSILIAMSTLNGIGTLIVLGLLSPTITAFFTWQVIVSSLYVALTATALWKNIPSGKERARCEWKSIKTIWRFAAGVSLISILGIILRQVDRVILSRLLPLETFGYYMLAITIGSSLSAFSVPIVHALFPRFSELIEKNQEGRLKTLYHHACQFKSIIIIPIGLTIAFFTYDLIYFWLRNETTAQIAAPLASIYIFGSILNALIWLPANMQLAYGWVRLGFYTNLVSVILLVPTTIFLTLNYGAIGAAFAWVILNIGYLLIEIPLMHKRILKGEMWQWYIVDVGLPFAIVSSIIFIGHRLISNVEDPLMRVLSLIGLLIIAQIGAIGSVPYGRQMSSQALKRIFLKVK